MNIATYLNYEITMRVQEHNNIMNILTKQRMALKNLWHVHGVTFQSPEMLFTKFTEILSGIKISTRKTCQNICQMHHTLKRLLLFHYKEV